MTDDPDLTIDIANRINEVMRHLPDHVQPGDVLSALAAISARLLTNLRRGDREPAYQDLMTIARAHSGPAPLQ